MLTPQEENVLKEIARNNTPLARPTVKHGYVRVNTSATLDEMAKASARRGKMQVQDLNDDSAVMSKLERAGVLRKNEKLGQFYARTGLGRASILEWSPGEIKRFVEVREENAAEEVPAPPMTFGIPQPSPGVRAILVG
jgi:hypothetical protein